MKIKYHPSQIALHYSCGVSVWLLMVVRVALSFAADYAAAQPADVDCSPCGAWLSLSDIPGIACCGRAVHVFSRERLGINMPDAALYHYYLVKDDTLMRLMPGKK